MPGIRPDTVPTLAPPFSLNDAPPQLAVIQGASTRGLEHRTPLTMYEYTCSYQATDYPPCPYRMPRYAFRSSTHAPAEGTSLPQASAVGD